MQWPPKIGDPLPRAAEAWCTRVKLVDWVLGRGGHADEWRRVFQVETADAEFVWEAIASAVPERPIVAVRGKGRTVSYGVLVDLMINDRLAPVLTAWHYEDPSAAPRLVTAYPKFYT